MRVTLHSLEKTNLSHRRRLKVFLTSLFKSEKTKIDQLSVIFCSDEYLLDINRMYLQHDYLTDIISFNLADSPESPVIGELYISVDRVKENSLSLGILFKTEILRVIFHGALHLCGYKDKSKADISQMRAKEDHYLHKYEVYLNVPRGT